MIKKELLFDNIYDKCIKEWPRELTLELKSEVSQTVEEHPDGYQLVKCKNDEWSGDKKYYKVYVKNKNLYDLNDSICDKYYYKKNEIIIVSLHEEIYNLIKNSALYIKIINLKDIRKQLIQKEFEDGLANFMKNPSDSWPKESIDLVHEYFRVNYPDQKEK